MREVKATRYVTALREGGSLPGLVEADDDGLYVVKFSGAGQGKAALVAEVIGGELGRSAGLKVPELVVVDVDPALGHAEPDPEIQELIDASPGINLGMDFLPGSLPFALDPDAGFDPALAADIVFFDALITNIDRTPRNPNLLTWHGEAWLIDHGAAFFRQHGDTPLAASALAPTPMLAEHVLLPVAGPLSEAGERIGGNLKDGIDAAVASVPDEWLGEDPALRRQDFTDFLANRLEGRDEFIRELEDDA